MASNDADCTGANFRETWRTCQMPICAAASLGEGRHGRREPDAVSKNLTDASDLSGVNLRRRRRPARRPAGERADGEIRASPGANLPARGESSRVRTSRRRSSAMPNLWSAKLTGAKHDLSTCSQARTSRKRFCAEHVFHERAARQRGNLTGADTAVRPRACRDLTSTWFFIRCVRLRHRRSS